MSENFEENVASIFQKSLPLIVSLAVMLLSFIPVNMALFNNVRPDFGMICIYFWMLHRPDLFGVWSVVVMGVVYSFISSALPGASLFAYLFMYVLVYNTQKFFYAKSFIVVWYGFMALSLVSILVKWLAVSIFYGQFLPLSMVVFSFLIAAALYPLMSVMLAYVQNKFIQDDGL